MKIIRALSIAFALFVPSYAIASAGDASCCDDGACCPTCPLCGAHHHK
jgi:hypothetical protein